MKYILAVWCIIFPSLALARTASWSGYFNSNDNIYGNGRGYYESRCFEPSYQQNINITMYSDDVDSYLIVRSPSGRQWSDDDGAPSGSDARIQIRDYDVTERGCWSIIATTYRRGDTGNYSITIDDSITAGRNARDAGAIGAVVGLGVLFCLWTEACSE